MKKVMYSKQYSSFCYIQPISNKVLIISVGTDNVFDFIGVFSKSVKQSTRKIKDNNIEIYIDSLSAVGDRSNRFSKLIFYKERNEVDIFSHKNLTRNELPTDIIKELSKFYTNKLDEILHNSILTVSEKQKIIHNPI